ncbi:MAG: hypothetical protein J7J44_02515 [Deltaproteobacteria bacterium]|nr:hypothetical protein [Deltaproteobacteria bacterium]
MPEIVTHFTISKITKEQNLEKKQTTYKILLRGKGEDGEIKLSMKFSEENFKRFKANFTLQEGAIFELILRQTQSKMDEFLGGEENE